MTELRVRDHNGECLTCDEQGPHAPGCAALQNLLARLQTDALCIQPDFCAATRREAAAEIELFAKMTELSEAAVGGRPPSPSPDDVTFYDVVTMALSEHGQLNISPYDALNVIRLAVFNPVEGFAHLKRLRASTDKGEP